MNNPVLFTMHGVYGSGKSTFARQLAYELPAAWVRSDRIRTELRAEREAPLTDQDEEIVFGRMNAATLRALSAGSHVIYDGTPEVPDVQQHIRAATANKLGLPAVTIWMQTPIDTCVRRAEHRTHDEHAVIIAEAEVRANARQLADPEPDELSIAIDGMAHFAIQYQQFSGQLEAIRAATG